MARSRETKIELTAYDDLFQTDESREEAKLSKIRDIPISEMGDALLQKTYTVDVLTKKVLNGDSTVTLEYIDRRMAELQEKLVLCANKNTEYDVIAHEIDALREKKVAVVTKDAEQEMLKKRIEEMRHFLQTQTSRVTEYDEQMVRRLIEKITVFDNKLIFEFKSGMTLELKR